MDPVTFLGIVGAIVALTFFLLNQTGKLDANNVWYDVGNLASGVILFSYALIIGSIPFAIINAVWGAIALKDLVMLMFKGGK